MFSRDDALEFLNRSGASRRLIRHAELVSETANELIACLNHLSLNLDDNFVLAGAVLHDAGKITYPQELDQPGNLHEEAGYRLLLDNDVKTSLARCCLSHARWQSIDDVSFEELVIALADHLWKGKRDQNLETRIIDETARRLGKDRWEIFIALDSCFEQIADKGADRLRYSH